MVNTKSYIRHLRELEGDDIVKMEVYRSDRDFLKGKGISKCARDNLHVIIDNIKHKRKIDNVQKLFKPTPEIKD